LGVICSMVGNEFYELIHEYRYRSHTEDQTKTKDSGLPKVASKTVPMIRLCIPFFISFLLLQGAEGCYAQMVGYRIARPTLNLELTTEFYTQALNLEKLSEFKDHEGFDGVMIGLPDWGHHLEFVYHPTYRLKEVAAPSKENLIVFYYETKKSYLEAIHRMELYGAKEVAPENPYWEGKAKLYEDPEGWRIVFVEP